MFKPNATVFEPQPEQACEEVIYSGGGFSNYFGMPDYQKDAVGGWLQQHKAEYVDKYGNRWNSTGTVRDGCKLGGVTFAHVCYRAVLTQISRQMEPTMSWRYACRFGIFSLLILGRSMVNSHSYMAHRRLPLSLEQS